MSQDIYISVQPVTGEDVYVNVSPNLAGVLFVNGRDGIVALNKSDVGLSNVENISITGVSGVLNQKINNLGSTVVYTTGNQTVSGTKTFASRPTVNGTGILLSGEASSLPNTVVYTTGNQTITGLKSFSDVTVTNKITLRNVETSWGGLGSGVYFSQPDNSATQIIDYIDTNLSITRGNVQSIYNAALENAWNGSGPSGTRWNRSGYDDLGNVASRTYDSLLNTFAGAIGANIFGSPLVMHDAINNKYYKILFNNWQQGGAAAGTYAGFSYTRWLIVNPTYPYPTVSGEKLNFKNKTEFDIRPIVKGTGVLLSGEVVAQLPNTIVYTTGNQTISGAKTFVNGIVAPNLVYNTGNQTISGDKTFNDGILFKKGNMPIGYLTGSFNEFLEANYLTLGVYPFSGNEGYIKLDYLGNGLQIGEDGIRLINNGLGGATYISSNTNNALFLQHPSIYINSTQTLFNSRPTVNYSGVLLSGEAYPFNNPSGYITGVDLSAYVTKSGGQFIDRPTVNGTGILLSGEAASLPTTIVYTTGDQTISGIKTFNNGLITSSISGVFGTGLNIQAGSGTSVINAGNLILMGGNLSGVSPNVLKTGARITIGGARTSVSTSDITITPSVDANASAGNIVLEAGLSPTYNGKINMFGDINVNGTSDIGTALSSKNINIYRRGNFFGGPSQRLAISIDNDNVDFQNGMGLRVSGIQVTPSAYVTGSVVRPSETGVFYPRSNPSGFITSQNVVYTFGDQIISGTKYFNNSVYIHDLYVTGTEFIATVQNNFIESPYILLNLTGGAIDGGIFFVTGSGLTGVNDYGPIIGFDHTNKFKFGTARRSDDLSTLNDIQAAPMLSNQVITGNTLLSAGRNRRITLSAFGVTANVDLPHENNQAGDVVTLVAAFSVASTLTIRSALAMSGGSPIAHTTLATLNASGQSFTFVSDGTATGWSLRAVDTHTHPASAISDSTTAGRALLTGANSSAQRSSLGLGTAATSASTDFYSSNNPSGYITGVDTSSLYPRSNPSGYITGVDLSNYYTINNPSGYITGVDLSNYYTINNPSGYITGVDLSNYYTKNNPSGYVRGIVNTTYSTLTGLKAVTGLTPGELYRISDFHLTWYNQSINNTGVKSGLAPEPLIVLALSGNKISHEAKSEIYPQDTVYYDIDASGSYSWGTLNTNRAIPNFKGWIYRRIDHQLNIDIGWDWRNITVNCCRPIVTGVPIWTGTTNYNRFSVVRGTGINTTGKLYYSIINSNSGQNFTNTNSWLPVSDFVEANTYFPTDENFGFRAYYKNGNFVNLPANTGTRIQQPTFTSSLTGQGTFTLTNCNNIKIEGGYSNVILGNNFRNNAIGSNFQYNTIGSNFQNNTIGNSFRNNTIGNGFTTNTIGNAFVNNTIGNEFSYNAIGNGFEANTIGNNLRYSTIGNNFTSNTIGISFASNTIGNTFTTNTIGNGFQNNTIGNSFRNNTIGNNLQYNTIGNNFYSNTIGNDAYYNTIAVLFNANTIGNEFSYNAIGNGFADNTIGNLFTTNTIGNAFVSNTIGNEFSYNAIGNIFEANTIGNNFRMNTSEDTLSIGNVTGATHIYNPYNTRIFTNSNGAVRLSYFNSSDQLVVTDPTA